LEIHSNLKKSKIKYIMKSKWENVASKLSIIVPVFNSKNTISKCIDYLVPLADKGIEILISDNNSTDGTKEILERYSEHPKIKIFYQEKNIGALSIYSIAEKVKTKYLLPIGSDDYLIDTTNLPNTVESLDQDDYSVGCNFKSSFIYGSKLVEDKTNIELKGDLRSRFCKFLLHVGANSRYYGIIKTQIFINNYPKISYFGDDVALSAKILSFGNWLYDEKIILHRERGLSSNPHKLKEVLGYKLIPPMRFAREIVEYSSSKWSITFWLCFFIYITKILIGPIRHFWTSRIYE
tara:strand:+ start:3142 stop:4020 length:879 start_codon:yes stop_codon:yes gene_type:complete